jgi:hypothetical protein
MGDILCTLLSWKRSWQGAHGERRIYYPSHSDVVLADDGESWKQVGHDEEVSDFFADVAEFEFAAVFAGGDVEANECAEAHAVHVGEVCEVEDKALVGGKQLGDGSVKELGETG